MGREKHRGWWWISCLLDWKWLALPLCLTWDGAMDVWQKYVLRRRSILQYSCMLTPPHKQWRYHSPSCCLIIRNYRCHNIMKKVYLLLLDCLNHGWSVLNAASYLAVDPWRNFNLSLLRTQSVFNRWHSLHVESLSSAAPSQYILHGNLRIAPHLLVRALKKSGLAALEENWSQWKVQVIAWYLERQMPFEDEMKGGAYSCIFDDDLKTISGCDTTGKWCQSLASTSLAGILNLWHSTRHRASLISDEDGVSRHSYVSTIESLCGYNAGILWSAGENISPMWGDDPTFI